jgi:hypothetical protein
MKPSPLDEIIRSDVEEAFEALLKNTVEPWMFFNSHGINIKKADGRSISISGFEFTGSAVIVFWDGFINDHIKKAGRTLIESTRKKAIERNISVQDALMACLTHTRSMIVKVFNGMAVIDQRLRGKGYPDSVQKNDVQHRIDKSYEAIKALIDIEFLLAFRLHLRILSVPSFLCSGKL